MAVPLTKSLASSPFPFPYSPFEEFLLSIIFYSSSLTDFSGASYDVELTKPIRLLASARLGCELSETSSEMEA